ncbi:Rad17-domain-containing protein [Lepidopterella palustris CBS 459.81]|uniref:Rad17-domain-containing protein n=1 Tax=Lepidopterella palustris CBS 459.81 TaxID=1314670 RepID=A0A8E2JCX2_9PEZI|nr:Rad17-domain-containing protein [Lepidopterella palustris CBS 459.81]
MGKPRAARQQPIVLSSDDEDETFQPSPKRPKGRNLRTQIGNKTRDTTWGPSGAPSRPQSNRSRSPKPSSPRRPSQIKRSSTKSPANSPVKPKPKYKPISSFFSAATQHQYAQPSASPEKPDTSTPLGEEDYIQDSSSDEKSVKVSDVQTKSATVLALRKRNRNTLGDGPGADSELIPGGSQKFLKTLSGSRGAAPLSQFATSEAVDQRPWTERYGPVNLDELAVHKKKASDVRNWLNSVLGGRECKRLLLLKGPAGSGKTTTMSLLSKELGFNIQEWKNPTTSVYSSEGFVSVTAQFEDFIGRTGKFGSLDFGQTKQTSSTPVTMAGQSREKQIILVEEFPNIFTRSSSAVQSFRNSVQQFLAANTPSMAAFFNGKKDVSPPVTPIVMIVSETLLSTNTAAADSFTAHRLLGPEILNHPGVSVIEFNPIAPTIMTKALELVILKEARKTGRRKTVGPQVIRRLAEVGDIRSAVSSLEFLCVRGDEGGGWGTKVTFTKPKKAVRDTPLTKMEQESLEMVTQRESTLGIFHAVGKVVYNKREPVLATNPPLPQPPNYFPEHKRPKASEVQVNTLIDELGTDTQTFIAALHENYLLSCEGSTSEDTMDSINGSIDALSDADLLSPDRFGNGGPGRRIFQSTSADNLRQEEMSFQVSVRGLLFSLPSPVKRIALPSGIMNGRGKGVGKSSEFQMFYPTSLRIWRQTEEIEGLISLWINQAQNGNLFTPLSEAAKAKEVKPGSVELWRKNAPFTQSTPTASTASNAKPRADEEIGPVLLGSGSSARYEMLLERLPYVASIIRNRAQSFSLGSLRDIKKVTAFTGIGGPSDEPPDDDEHTLELEQWSTDPPTNEPGAGHRRRGGRSSVDVKLEYQTVLGGVLEKHVANLLLSDDDIEDE